MTTTRDTIQARVDRVLLVCKGDAVDAAIAVLKHNPRIKADPEKLMDQVQIEVEEVIEHEMWMASILVTMGCQSGALYCFRGAMRAAGRRAVQRIATAAPMVLN